MPSERESEVTKSTTFIFLNFPFPSHDYQFFWIFPSLRMTTKSFLNFPLFCRDSHILLCHQPLISKQIFPLTSPETLHTLMQEMQTTYYSKLPEGTCHASLPTYIPFDLKSAIFWILQIVPYFLLLIPNFLLLSHHLRGTISMLNSSQDEMFGTQRGKLNQLDRSGL